MLLTQPGTGLSSHGTQGIEELQQASGLQGFGCDAGQGFLFGRPVDARTVHETYFPRATVRVVN